MQNMTYGIDKIVVTGFIIKDIDYRKTKQEKVKVYKEGKYKYELENKSQETFSSVVVKDGIKFNMLVAGVKVVGNNLIKYCMIDIANSGNNLNPKKQMEVIKKVEKIIGYIKQRYGIELDEKLENLKYKELELNVNIELEENFNEYLNAIKKLMKAKFKKINMYDDTKNGLETIIGKNKTYEIKMYNKIKQLKECKEINEEQKENILRIEYKLKTYKIRAEFVESNITKITDEHIKFFLWKQINQDFKKKFEKRREEDKKKLRGFLKKAIKNKQWKKEFSRVLYEDLDKMNKRQVVDFYDVEDILEEIKELDKINYSRNTRELKRICPESFQGLNKQIGEIFEKIEKCLS